MIIDRFLVHFKQYFPISICGNFFVIHIKVFSYRHVQLQFEIIFWLRFVTSFFLDQCFRIRILGAGPGMAKTTYEKRKMKILWFEADTLLSFVE
jgi:hypothetical protein